MAASAEPRPSAPPRTGSPAPAGRRLPDFFVVGHPKCGTTALYEMLRRHPRIFMPDCKEPVFFARELPRRAHRYRAPDTLAEYARLFADAGEGQLVGEASASYLWSRVAARAIAELVPDARAIAILREPASFLRSLHLQCLRSRYESERDLTRALALEDERRRGRRLPRGSRWPQVLLYSEHVRYVQQLRRYEAALGRERMLVLVYDDFRQDNASVLSGVLRFLGVEPALAPDGAVEANPTVVVRRQRLDDLLHAVSIGDAGAARALKPVVKALVPGRARRGALRAIRRRAVYAAPPAPDEAVMLALRRRFAPEVQALSEYLGRDLVRLWAYDRLA